MKRILSGALLFWMLLGSLGAGEPVPFTRTEDVIYGRKFGTALTLDVFQPQNTNGLGVLLMVSGGWFSAHESISPMFMRAMLNRGYTVFAVVHGSQPKFVISEIEQDIHRAVRFVRHNAARYGVDPERLGICGGSAGGHLSLIMGVKGAPGDPKAKDVIDRESSRVQCVAAFFPPTDFLNYNRPGDDAVGVGTLKSFRKAFGTEAETPEGRQKLGHEISPIYFVASNTPPVLLIHGDADKLVPLYQSEQFVKRCQELGVKTRLEVRPGKEHGWADMQPDLEAITDWFDENLRGIHPKSAGTKIGAQ